MTPDFASNRVLVIHNANTAYSRTWLKWAGVKKDTGWFWKAFFSSLCQIRPDIFIDFHLLWTSICIT